MACNPIPLLSSTGTTTIGSAQTGNAVSAPAVQAAAAEPNKLSPQSYGQSLQTTFYVSGTFGTSTLATLQIEASPDGTNWYALVDGSFTAVGFVTVNMNARYFRAVTTSGDTGTALEVVML